MCLYVKQAAAAAGAGAAAARHCARDAEAAAAEACIACELESLFQDVYGKDPCQLQPVRYGPTAS